MRARGSQRLRLLPPPRHVSRREQLLRRLLDRVLPPVEPVRGAHDAREGARAERAELAELCCVARDNGQRLRRRERGGSSGGRRRQRDCCRCCGSSSRSVAGHGRPGPSSGGAGHEDVGCDGRRPRPAVVAAEQRRQERRRRPSLLLLLRAPRWSRCCSQLLLLRVVFATRTSTSSSWRRGSEPAPAGPLRESPERRRRGRGGRAGVPRAREVARSCCRCRRVVLHGLVCRGDKVLRAVRGWLRVFRFFRRKGGVEREGKIRTSASEASCNSRDEFLSLSSLFLPSSLHHSPYSYPSMYASIWLCGASCDSGRRSQLGSS